MEHEAALIQSFIKKDKQERYLTLLAYNKGRDKFRLSLSHLELNYERAHKILPSEQYSASIIDLLKRNNAPERCYIICEHSEFDRKVTTIEQALSLLFAQRLVFFISCIPGKLVYFENEGLGERYLLY
ncbi:hypothetical protein [Paradesertivirga mongoliensis]|uniref:hypothetical protein n=1 Tax=Paradesertivirga mongoliensis TaxID=2100740 RepID=UPI002108FE73|nr:hypothetical protein [Pedobacter mongoliensis]